MALFSLLQEVTTFCCHNNKGIINYVIQILRLDKREYGSQWNKTILKKLTVYNKDFIDWARVQPQFCLTLERSVAISLRPRATEPRELESNKKTDVVFDPDQ